MMRSPAAGRRDADTPEGWTALGASVQLVVTHPGRLERARVMLEAELTAIDAACNRLRAGSEVAALDDRPTGPVQVSPLLADAIAAALRAARLTDGDLDPTVGDAFAGTGRPDGGQPGGVHPEPAPSLAAFLNPAASWQQVRLDAGTGRLWLPAGIRLVQLDLSLKHVHFGLVACRELVPDIETLASYLVDELELLLKAADERAAS